MATNRIVHNGWVEMELHFTVRDALHAIQTDPACRVRHDNSLMEVNVKIVLRTARVASTPPIAQAVFGRIRGIHQLVHAWHHAVLVALIAAEPLANGVTKGITKLGRPV